MTQTASPDRTAQWVLPGHTAGGPDRPPLPDRTADITHRSGPDAIGPDRYDAPDRTATTAGPIARIVGAMSSVRPRSGPTPDVPDRTAGPDRPAADAADPSRRPRSGGVVTETSEQTGTAATEDRTAEETTGKVDGKADADRPSWPLRISAFLLDGSLTIVTTFLAATGQVAFGVWAGIADERKFLIPGITELFALAFLVKGYLRAKANKSPLAYWTVSAAFGAFAVWTNLVHGDAKIATAANPDSLDLIGGADASGLIFGIASAACQVLWFVGAYEAYQKYRERNGRARKARAKFGDLWFTDTRVTFRAWRISGRLQIDDVDKCLELADLWIMLFERFRQATITTQKRDKKAGTDVDVVNQVGSMLARRSAWREVLISTGRKLASIPQTAGLAVIGEVSTSTMSQRHLPPPEPETVDDAAPVVRRRRPSPRPRPTVDEPTDEVDDEPGDEPDRHPEIEKVSSISAKVNEDRQVAERIFNLICAAVTKESPETPIPQSWDEAKELATRLKVLSPVVRQSGYGKSKVYRILKVGPQLYPLPGDRISA